LENVNYLFPDPEYTKGFPLILHTQYFSKENKKTANALVKTPLKAIFDYLDNVGFFTMSIKHQKENMLINIFTSAFLIFSLVPFNYSHFFQEGDFVFSGDEVQKLRRLNINGVKIKNNAPAKYERKYLEELLVYLYIYAIYQYSFFFTRCEKAYPRLEKN
jgi:hypothetical protein